MTRLASRRAMLFVPGNSQRMLDKISSLTPGSFILDLEDSVPPGEKARAREMVSDFIHLNARRSDLHVRINQPTSSYALDDLAAVAHENLAGVVIPKVESADDVRMVNDALLGASARYESGVFKPEIIATIETATGLHHVHEIAATGGFLHRLGFGSGDFARDLGLEWPDERGASEIVLYAKIQVVLGSRIAGLAAPHDGSYTNYADLDGLAREARQSRRLGFSGKHVIHPSQIPVVRDAFQPSRHEIDRAVRQIELFTHAEQSGRGTIGVDGELIDYAIVERARQLLDEFDE